MAETLINAAPLNVSMVFGVSMNGARCDYAVMQLPFEEPLKGWFAQKAGVMIKGKKCIVELFVCLDNQTEMELQP